MPENEPDPFSSCQVVAFNSRERWLSLMPFRKRASDKKEEEKKEEDA